MPRTRSSNRTSRKTTRPSGRPRRRPRVSAAARTVVGAKLDFYVKHKNEYLAGQKPSLVRVGPAKYLSYSGQGQSGEPAFAAAIHAIFNVAFTLKMAYKRADKNYVMPKLEALWWRAHPAALYWNWQLLLRVPRFVNEPVVAKAIDGLRESATTDDVFNVALIELRENTCVQVLHTGARALEKERLEASREFAARAGRSFTGKLHRIYLTGPLGLKPEELRTILRHPVT